MEIENSSRNNEVVNKVLTVESVPVIFWGVGWVKILICIEASFRINYQRQQCYKGLKTMDIPCK